MRPVWDGFTRSAPKSRVLTAIYFEFITLEQAPADECRRPLQIERKLFGMDF